MSWCGIHVFPPLLSLGLPLKRKLKKIKLTLVLKCKVKQAGRRTDRQFERQIDRHTYVQADRQTHRQTRRQADKKTDRQTKSRRADKKTSRRFIKPGRYINLTTYYKWLTVALTGNFSLFPNSCHCY